MKTPWNFLLLGLVIVINVLAVVSSGQAAERIETTNSAGIQLSYTSEQKLTAMEVHQVLSLAQQIGITNVGSISLGTTIPVLSTIVVVKGRERVNGRNTAYETATIDRIGWTSQERPAEALKAGDFWVRASSKYTHFERTYELAGTLRRVAMLEKDVAVADKVIPLVAAGKVRFNNESANTVFNFARHQFERIDLSKPDVLRKRDSPDEYELEFSKSQHIIYFQYKDGAVLVTTVGLYSI